MPSAQERLFRSAALERLSSPDGLDTLMEATTVGGWLSLAGLGTVVAAALAWGIMGQVPQVVSGAGIMIREGGVYRVQATAAGQIDSVLVEPGVTVRRGQPVAILAQPELRASIDQLQASLVDLRSNRATTDSLLSTDRRMELASIAQQQKQADETGKAAQARLAYLDQRIANEQRALDRGLLTPDVAQNTIALRAETQQQLLGTVARKQELSAREVQLTVASTQRLFTLDQQITQSTNRLDQLAAQLAAAAQVVSAYDGIVLERLADVGQSITSGAAVATVEATDVPLQVLMFIPLEGKRIAPGMKVEMVPGGLRPEETGYFLGTVRSVSSAPLSGTALDRYLKNELLVEQFTSKGGAYLVDVTVLLDSSTVSGFRWTSRTGAPIAFGSGTLLDGKITIESKRPLALMIPALRRWLRV